MAGRVKHDSSDEGDSVRVQCDWADVAPSTAVVEAVADVVGREPETLPTLYDVVETDGLDELLRSGDPELDGPSVTFWYADTLVTVYSDGVVVVRDIDRP